MPDLLTCIVIVLRGLCLFGVVLGLAEYASSFTKHPSRFGLIGWLAVSVACFAGLMGWLD